MMIENDGYSPMDAPAKKCGGEIGKVLVNSQSRPKVVIKFKSIGSEALEASPICYYKTLSRFSK
jgi:hypothetical protein